MRIEMQSVPKHKHAFCTFWRASSRDYCTKSVTGLAALLRILAGCAKRKGRIPAVVFDR
jgi:hypothetical protein